MELSENQEKLRKKYFPRVAWTENGPIRRQYMAAPADKRLSVPEVLASLAARAGFKKYMLEAKPQLLEPVMNVEVTMPEDYFGAVSGSIGQRRGRIESMEDKGGQKVIHAQVPLAEMFGYSNTVRTLTQGRGAFTMIFNQ